MNGSSITSGVINPSRLGSNTTNAASFLRGDELWSLVSGSAANIYLFDVAMHAALSNNILYTFLGANSPEVSVVAGQKVLVTVTARQGTNGTGGASLNRLNIGHQQQGSTTIVEQLSDWMGICTIFQNTRLPFTLRQIFLNLPTGSYYFGMIYQADRAEGAKWNSNEWSRGQVTIVN